MFAAGKYRGRMVSVSLGKSENKGTPELRFRFFPTGRYSADGLEPCTPEERTIFKYITDGTIDYLIQDLAALGYDRDSFADIDSESPNAFPWTGIEFDAGCFYESYQGKDKEKWEFARGASKGKPIENREVQELDAKFSNYLKGAKKPAAAAAATGGSGSNDPIPF